MEESLSGKCGTIKPATGKSESAGKRHGSGLVLQVSYEIESRNPGCERLGLGLERLDSADRQKILQDICGSQRACIRCAGDVGKGRGQDFCWTPFNRRPVA